MRVFASAVAPCYTCTMAKPATTPWDSLNLPFLRFTGRHLSAMQQLLRACREHSWPIEPQPATSLVIEDASLIDPTRPLSRPSNPELVPSPGYRPTFRSLTAEQRWVYYQWLQEHNGAAPVGYGYLYVMQLETALFDEHALAALAELRWVVEGIRAPGVHEFATFSLAFGAWLHRQPELFDWLIQQQVLLTYFGSLALSFQADLQIPLYASQAIYLAPWVGHTWSSWARQHPEAVEAAVRDELAAGNNRFLAEAAARLAEQRHKIDLRLLNYGLALRVDMVEFTADEQFRQGLREVLRLGERAAQLGGHFVPRTTATAQPAQWVDRGWYLVLEFGETTSDKLDRVLRVARQHPGYVKLLDENRQIVYRTLYRRRDLSLFWSLFERVRSWKSTRVYVNGNPISLAYLWPGSPALML